MRKPFALALFFLAVFTFPAIAQNDAQDRCANNRQRLKLLEQEKKRLDILAGVTEEDVARARTQLSAARRLARTWNQNGFRLEPSDEDRARDIARSIGWDYGTCFRQQTSEFGAPAYGTISCIMTLREHLVNRVGRLQQTLDDHAYFTSELEKVNEQIRFHENRLVELNCNGDVTHTPPTRDRNPRGAAWAELVKVVIGEPTSDMRMSGDRVYVGKNSWPTTFHTLADGRIVYDGAPLHATYTWSRLPETIGREGVDIDVTVTARTDDRKNGFGTGINISGGLPFEPSPSSLALQLQPERGQDSRSQTYHAAPVLSLPHGHEFVITVGAFYGPGVTYTYRVR